MNNANYILKTNEAVLMPTEINKGMITPKHFRLLKNLMNPSRLFITQKR